MEAFDVTKKNFAKMRGMVEKERPKPFLYWREIWPRCEGKGMMIRIGGLEISSWGQVESLAKSQEEERTLKEALGAPEQIARGAAAAQDLIKAGARYLWLQEPFEPRVV